jgi:hypothetical protein
MTTCLTLPLLLCVLLPFAAGFAQTVTVAAAGDIACGPTAEVGADHCQMAATANLIADKDVTAVLALGDLQYPQGSYDDFLNAYDKSWGRFKAITYPTPGNHEYLLYDAQGYYRYFGAAARETQDGYYSFDLGTWHIVALNSNCLWVGGCGADSAQVAWLRRDLEAHPSLCVLAFWHHPRFSSGPHGSDETYQAFWDVLHAAGADVVLNGHDHLYERFAPQSADGTPDLEGIREFVVGTGGASTTGVEERQLNSEVVAEGTFGVLFLRLAPDGYTWSFESAAGTAFTDSGEGTCH